MGEPITAQSPLQRRSVPVDDAEGPSPLPLSKKQTPCFPLCSLMAVAISARSHYPQKESASAIANRGSVTGGIERHVCIDPIGIAESPHQLSPDEGGIGLKHPFGMGWHQNP